MNPKYKFFVNNIIYIVITITLITLIVYIFSDEEEKIVQSDLAPYSDTLKTNSNANTGAIKDSADDLSKNIIFLTGSDTMSFNEKVDKLNKELGGEGKK